MDDVFEVKVLDSFQQANHDLLAALLFKFPIFEDVMQASLLAVLHFNDQEVLKLKKL